MRNRYYITRREKDGPMTFPPLPIPDTTCRYGENGAEFGYGIGKVWGWAEYEGKELAPAAVKEFGLIPGPIPTYYPIDEDLARRAQENMSFRDYRQGTRTAEYRRDVDEASLMAYRHKAHVDAMYHEKIDGLLDAYARKLAQNMNEFSQIMTRCPSVMIAGPANFPVRKKEKQNAAADRNTQEYREIRGLLDRIRSVGTGGISSDDPLALEKLEKKLESLEKHQELMKAANAAVRMKDTEKGDARLAELGYSPEEIKQLRTPDFCGRTGYPAYELTNNNANIHRIRERIESLKKRQAQGTPEGWTFEGGEVKVNKELNRVQILFDGRPDEGTRAELKSNGFRWAPSQGAWQRQYTENAIRAARSVVPPAGV